MQAPLFPLWRAGWAAIPSTSRLLTEVDAVLCRRRRGNTRLPKIDSTRDDEHRMMCLLALQHWASGQPPPAARRSTIALQIMNELAPLILAVSWGRWLHLELALDAASRSSDLLFAAFVLRTMCEEVLWLHALDLGRDDVQRFSLSSDSAEQRRFRIFLEVANLSLAPTIAADDYVSPDLQAIAKTLPAVQNARRLLHDYVHPNFGSHVAALYPERAQAAQVVLQGIRDVYGAFLALSWAEKPYAAPTLPSRHRPKASWRSAARYVRNHVLHDVECELSRAGVEAASIVQPVTAWLSEGGGSAAELPDHHEMGTLLGQIVEPWEGARPNDLMTLACARRAERNISEQFPQGAPQPADQTRWLRFQALAFELAMCLDAVKGASFRCQLIRQISEGNALGVALCVRSLIEHLAVSKWLVQTVSSSMSESANRATAAGPLPTAAQRTGDALAKFLAGTKGTEEEPRAWANHAAGATTQLSVNLLSAVEKAFPKDDRFAQLYSITTDMVHGRRLRGLDLLRLRAIPTPTGMACLAVIVLARLLEDKGPLLDACLAYGTLSHAANAGGALHTKTRHQAQMIFGGHPGRLERGRDYRGDGSREHPFTVHSHVDAHSGVIELARQLEASFEDRRYDHSADGRLCEVYSSTNGDLWFDLRFLDPKASDGA